MMHGPEIRAPSPYVRAGSRKPLRDGEDWALIAPDDQECVPPHAAPPASIELDQREAQRASVEARLPHRVARLPPAVGGAARVEDLEAAVGRPLVQRDVRVAEDDRRAAVEALPQALQPAAGRAGV